MKDVHIGIRLDRDTLKHLRELATTLGRTPTELVRYRIRTATLADFPRGWLLAAEEERSLPPMASVHGD